MKKSPALSNSLDHKPEHKPDHHENPYVTRQQSRHESGVVTRAILVITLSLTLVGVLRWALNVTNANARQISSNLTRLQGHYDSQDQSMAPRNTGSLSIRPSRDPVIEPESY